MAVILFAALIFVVDLQTPLGFGAGVLYVFPQLLIAWQGRRPTVLVFAAIFTLLILLGYLYSPPGPVTGWIPIANRVMAVLVLWLVTIFFLERRDIAARMRAERERNLFAEQQRNTLVREVHHRIKNNLQGVAGLLRQHCLEHPELREVLERAIAQVQTMSVVYGLQGKGEFADPTLCDMVLAISGMLDGLTPVPVTPCLSLRKACSIRIATDEAVPLALILNELAMNAVKHGEEGQGAVTVHVEGNAGEARVSMTNTGKLPGGFSFAEGAGLGTGLSLVRSLLPRAGALLEFQQEAGSVTTVLTLRPPVIGPVVVPVAS